MKLLSMRARFLSAMGLTVAGCQESAPPVTSVVDLPPVATRASDAMPEPSSAPPTLAVDAGTAIDTAVASETDAGPPKPPEPAEISWAVVFPRRKSPQPWCKNEYAVCYDSTKELAKCPPSHEVYCQRWKNPSTPGPCAGELMKAISQKERAKHPLACCYDAHSACVHPTEGRPYRPTNGLAITAARDHVPSSWCAQEGASSRPSLAKAKGWARAGQLEHASVASFAKLALDLLALGAPPELVRCAHEAAIDEVAHATMSFTMAARFDPDGRAWSPGPLVARAHTAHDLVSLARETFVDGCIGESLAALDARARAEDSNDAVERAVLETIAADEERHAELGWKIVAWAARRESRVLGALSSEACGDPALRATLVEPCLRALAASLAPKVNELTLRVATSVWRSGDRR